MRGSDFYGIGNTLLHFAGLPRVGVFPYAVQHGWQHAATRYEADGQPQEIWAWSERSRQAMATHYPLERIRVIGSPYLYLEPLGDDAPTARRGSIYVMPHSSHFARIGFSMVALRDLVAEIGAAGGGCDVLAYYLDVSEALCASLRATGSRILVNGGLWSDDFMNAFRRNIRMYERVHYSSFGSAVLFSRHEQRDTRFVELPSRVVESSNAYVDQLGAEDAFDAAGDGWDTAQEMGVDRRIGPTEMRALILRGWQRESPGRLALAAGRNLRNRLADHFGHVRTRIALAVRHNAIIDGHA